MSLPAQQLSRRVVRSVPVLAVTAALALALSGCGGGGGGGDDGSGGSAASWRTAEYSASNGLELIGAARGYALRTTGAPGGSGITVAVLDDGVFPHRDIGQFAQFRLPGANVTGDHGTPVAGIIVARRNGSDGHGVAYNANLVSIATCNTCTTSYRRDAVSNLVAASIASAAGLTRTYGNIRSNPDAGSHVMNMSFTFPGSHDIPRITSAMRDAARANRIMVAALGNDAETGPAGAPASNMADSGIAGFGIAVGSLDRSGAGRADHSNTCGTVARYCLFAPGEGVVTTRNGGGLAPVSGTSFAAPHVSGAAAVVWGAFPNKDADQIVDRLLTTARPLDGREISPTYGHGALDLAAALNPVGFLSLPMEGSGAVPVRESFVDLPPGFGAPAAAALSSAVVYDQQAFPFLYDLNAAFRARGARSSTGAMAAFLSSLGGSTSVSIPGHGAVLEFTHEGGEFDPLRERAAFIEDGGPWGLDESRRDETRNYSLRFKLAPDVTASIGQGHGSPGASNSPLSRRGWAVGCLENACRLARSPRSPDTDRA